MDLYYEDYASNTDFYDINDFIFQTGSAYAALLQAEYNQHRAEMRADRQEGYATFSHDWLQTQTIQITRSKEEGDYYLLKQKPMSFPFDMWDIGIQNVFPVGARFTKELIRDSIDKSWQDDLLPNTKNVFWSLIQDRIIVKCNSVMVSPPPFIRIIYVPDVSPDLEIPASRNAIITTTVISMMRKIVDEGHLVKTTNNQNKNTLPVTENDRDLINP